MSIFRPDAAIKRWLDHARQGVTTLQNCTLHLYTTNRTWLTTDDTAQATAIEATFGGYASQTITDWGAATISGSVGQTQAGIYVFTASGSGLPQTVYGVYVLDAGGNLLYVEVNPTGGVTLSAAGNTFAYRPQWSDKNI